METVESIVASAINKCPTYVKHTDIDFEAWKLTHGKRKETQWDSWLEEKRALEKYLETRLFAPDDFGDYVHVPYPQPDWIIQGRWGEDYYIKSPVHHVIRLLDNQGAKMLRNPKYLPERTVKIKDALENGISPLFFTPIIFAFFIDKEYTSIIDGLHRLAVFEEKGYQWINSRMTVYWNYSLHSPPNEKLHNAMDIVHRLNAGIPEHL